MAFTIFIFLSNLFVPFVMFIAGIITGKAIPTDINVFYGYRTTRSMKNQDTWNFAQEHFSRIWVKISRILLIPSAVVQIPFCILASSQKILGIMTVILQILQLLIMFGSMFLVEKALKENFDKDGNRINKEL